jgi:RNA polymerase sigma factor (sigma-70 family)
MHENPARIVVKVKDMRVNDGSIPATAAIEEAYRRRSGGFLAWAKRHAPDEASAEDALQDAFGRALLNADALSMVEDVAGWIFSAMRNRLIDLWRGEGVRRRAGQVDVPDEMIEEIASAAGVDPQDSLLRSELEEALETAIEALPEEQREVIRAQALGGTAFRELAERTGVSIDTLMSRKRRALRKLAAALEYWMED